MVELHFETELLSFVLLGIIWLYSRQANMVPTLRNRLFKACYYGIFFSIITDLLSVILALQRGSFVPMVLIAGESLHCIANLLSVLLFQLYLLAYVYEKSGKGIQKAFCASLLPFAVFLALVLSYPLAGLFPAFGGAGQAASGRLPFIVYGFRYLYCAMMAAIVIRNRKHLSRQSIVVLLIFPVSISLSALVQQIWPQLYFSEFAAVCVLLVAYLYLQNKRIMEDHMTGLPNRAAYLQMISWLIEKKQSVTVMVISLNDYKFINDKFGQASGDLLLQQISFYLRSVGPDKGVYRFGGDKFAVIFAKQPLPSASEKINRISERFNRAWMVSGGMCHITAAIGVAQYPTSADSCGELVSMLEAAVQRSKLSGGTQPLVFCDRSIIQQVRRKHMIYELLRFSLLEDRIQVYYQPLYSVALDRFTEAEALIRIRDEGGELISPDEFVPIAEETGLIVDIGYAVLKKTCEYIRRLLQRGIEVDTISVNLSIAQMMKPDFVPRALQIIHGSGISPSRIVFEITESMLVSNYDVISKKIKELSGEGIHFALDDFGTGYSNLTHVMDLPFDVVKIDKSLIWNSMNNPKCYVMVRDMAQIFQNLNLMVTAEGIETAEHDRFVRSCGCSRIQGFRYAPPLTGEAAAEYLGHSRVELTS